MCVALCFVSPFSCTFQSLWVLLNGFLSILYLEITLANWLFKTTLFTSLFFSSSFIDQFLFFMILIYCNFFLFPSLVLLCSKVFIYFWGHSIVCYLYNALHAKIYLCLSKRYMHFLNNLNSAWNTYTLYKYLGEDKYLGCAGNGHLIASYWSK